jgi:hypothetical protein
LGYDINVCIQSIGAVLAEMLGYASTNLVFLFPIGLCIRLRFLLLALPALSQVPCKKALEFLILKFLFGPKKLGFIPDRWMSDQSGPGRKEGDCEVESGDKRIGRRISDSYLSVRQRCMREKCLTSLHTA